MKVNYLGRKYTHNMNINDREFVYYQYAAKSGVNCFEQIIF